MDVRLKDAEMGVLRERLIEYKRVAMLPFFPGFQANYKDQAQEMEQQVEEMKLVKVDLIIRCNTEIEHLRDIIKCLVTRSAGEEIKSGLLKAYTSTAILLDKVQRKVFPTAEARRESDRQGAPR